MPIHLAQRRTFNAAVAATIASAQVASGSGSVPFRSGSTRANAQAATGSAAVQAPTIQAGGHLAAGVRATPGTVGYLGAEGALTVINPGASLTGALSGGSWDGNTLELGGASRNLNLYRFNCKVVLTGSNPTVTNCKVVVGLNSNVGVYHPGSGVLTIEDCTVLRSPAAQSGDIPIHLIASDSQLIARRCQVEGGGDQIHFTGPGSLISQCVAVNQAFADADQHADGMQVFESLSTGGSYTIEHCYFDSTGGVGELEANSCVTQGPAPATTDGQNKMAATINNNYFDGGLHPLRIDGDMENCVVTNNNFGPENAFGEVFVRNPSCIATWSNNRDSSNVLISQP